MVGMSPEAAARRATIEDVAAHAGVSVATVSRALRGLPNVAEATRARVADAAQLLSYRADPHASRLAAGRTMTVAVGVPMLGRWYFSIVVAAIEAAVAVEGYDVLLFAVGTDEARHRIVSNWSALSRRVDGLILVDVALDEEETAELAAQAAPIVTIGYSTEGLPSVRIDDEAGAAAATRHLLGLGHEAIAIVGDQPAATVPFVVPHARRVGYHSALEAAGITPSPELELPAAFTVADGVVAGRMMLSRAKPPTAVFAMSDEMAFGVLKAAREHGRNVPGDLSVVGFDDHELADVVELTTIAQPVRRVGAVAARLLLDRLVPGAGVEPEHIELPTHLVVRGTTGRPSGGAA